MSELKTRFVDDTYVEYFTTGKHDLAQIYLKSEADKVIAEKDAEIAELKKERDWLAKDRAQAYDDLEKRAQLNIKQDADIKELKRQIEFLKTTHNSCGDCNKCADGMGKVFEENFKKLKAENKNLKDTLGGTNIAYKQCYDEYKQCDKELRHHKYKRCLDKAEICCEKKENCYNRALRKYSKDEADYLVRKSEFWQDWEFRWIKLAEKFKEVK